MSKCQKVSIQALYSFLLLGDVLEVSDTNWNEEEEEASSSLQEQFMHSTNMSKDTMIFLDCMVNEHVSIHEFSITQEKNSALNNFEIQYNSV